MSSRSSRRTSAVVLLLVIALVMGACSGAEEFDDPEVFRTPPVDEVADSIVATGFTVIDDVADGTGQWPTITANQLASMSAEVVSLGGLGGRQLDEIMPAQPEGTPPFSYWIAAWLHDAPTERAELATQWYPEDTDWSQAPNLRYPRAVLMLFVADVAEDFDANQPPLDPDLTFEVGDQSSAQGGVLYVSAVDMPEAVGVGDICLTITDFFRNQIGALFNMLRVAPGWAGGGVFGFVGGLLASLWNTVVALARDVVVSLVHNLTAPVMEWIGRAIAVAGIVSHVSTYIDGWNVDLIRSPESIHWGPPNREGRFRVQPAEKHRPWDRALVDCAKAFNITLPDLLAAGSPVQWEVSAELGSDPNLIVETHRDTVVPANGRPELRYRNPIEPIDPPHTGEEEEGQVYVIVKAPRGDLRNVLTMGRNLITGTIAGLVPAIPVVNLRGAVEKGLTDLLNPVLNQVERALTSEIGSVLEVSAVQRVTVGYHTATTTTTSSTMYVPPAPRPPLPDRRPPCETGCGHSQGDPHLRTVDGHRYEFQGAGEFVLLRWPDNSAEIQIRYEPVPNSGQFHVSATTAVAVRAGSQVVEWYDDRGTVVDGQVLLLSRPMELEGGFAVEALAGGMVVDLPDGSVLWTVNRAVMVDPSPAIREAGLGLIGLGAKESGLPFLPDGTSVAVPEDREGRFEARYRTFGPAWLVTSDTSLFEYGDGESAEGFFRPDFPALNRTLLGLDELEDRPGPDGEAACGGINDEDLRAYCLFDVTVTGDVSWATDYVVIDRLQAEGPVILGSLGRERERREDECPFIGADELADLMGWGEVPESRALLAGTRYLGRTLPATLCTFKSEDDLYELELTVYEDGDIAEQFDKLHDELVEEATFYGPEVTAIAGLGDDAAQFMHVIYGHIIAHNGDRIVSLAVTGGGLTRDTIVDADWTPIVAHALAAD